jgi:endoglycosylceramidase
MRARAASRNRHDTLPSVSFWPWHIEREVPADSAVANRSAGRHSSKYALDVQRVGPNRVFTRAVTERVGELPPFGARAMDFVVLGRRHWCRKARLSLIMMTTSVVLLASVGVSGAATTTSSTEASTTTTVSLPPTSTTTTRPTTTTTGHATTTTQTQPTKEPATTTTHGSETTSSVPSVASNGTFKGGIGNPHVAHEPDLTALTPHIVALSGPGTRYQFSTSATSIGSTPGVPSFLSSPGGPYMYDSTGRMVILHGVNVVYKHAPYIAYPDPGKPWNFDANDARQMRTLGFNAVRLGIEWQALEPGSGGPNQAKICTPGTPGDPHEYNAAIADAYLEHVRATVNLLARYGIYTLLDMHQDVYDKLFRGEGAPEWAVCTNNVPIVPKGGRWSNNYSNAQLDTAVGHFWTNDVVGDLQGQFDMVWATVAGYFKHDPWVIGYDPYNEPFSTETTTAAKSTFTQDLECFYTGKDHMGLLANGQTALVCPTNDPENGVVATIESIDHKHLIFVEPDIYWVPGGTVPSQLGPMPFPRLVFNFHDYCGDRSPLTGDPTNLLKCLQSEETSAAEQDVTRLSMASRDQPTGPAIYMSEFGATDSVALAGFDTEWAGLNTVGWMYWAWKYYDDPTGSSAEGLVLPNGTYSPIVTVLSRTYPQEVAGVANAVLFNPFTGGFSMAYTPSSAAQGQTIVNVAASQHYPQGWCAAVKGGKIVSPAGDTHLRIRTAGVVPEVYVSVTAGSCPSAS